MSNNKVISATSSRGPSNAAVSLCPTLLDADVPVKAERIEPVIDPEVRMAEKSIMGQRLQVSLTRLPSSLLKLFITEPKENDSLDTDTTQNIEESGKSKIKLTFSDLLALLPRPVSKDAVKARDLGLHTELDIKFESEYELKEEPEDYSIDYEIDDVVDDNDSCESDEEIDVVSLDTTTQQPLASTSHVRTDTLPRTRSAQRRRHKQRTISTAITPRPAARKRLVPPPAIASSSATRRRRGLGRRIRRRGVPACRGRRSYTYTDSEAESPEIERRSMHNDMERLRRTGIKNLFDELKKQIPATRNKKRAPKVVILREAVALCGKLREEDDKREYLKKQQTKLVTKLKKLRTMLTARPYRVARTEQLDLRNW